MPRLPSLPPDTQLHHVFEQFRRGLQPLLELHDAVLRDKGPLSVGQREMIAAYVSGLNSCNFCYGSHRIHAEVHGVDMELFEALLADIDTAPIAEPMKPLLHYVRKLTLNPSQLTDADAEAVFGAGWSEEALFLAIQVTACFCFMNRIVEGTGVVMDSAAFNERRQTVKNSPDQLRSRTYVGYGRELGLID